MAAPKAKHGAAGSEELIGLFKSFGLPQSKAAEAAKNPTSAAILKSLIQETHYGLAGASPDEKQAALISAFATQLVKTELGPPEKGFVIAAVLDHRLKSVDQVTAATKYLHTHPLPVNEHEFEKECGVGYTISPEGLASAVSHYLSSNANTVIGWANLGPTITALKITPDLRWANPLDLKNAVESAFNERFGAKEAAKPKTKEPKKETTPKHVAEAEAALDIGDGPSTSTATLSNKVFSEGFLGSLHKPGGNPQIDPKLMEQHLAWTHGTVYTRFPPEPNGFLHVGHSKAIFINFGYAQFHGGKCYLRYDDTNPEAEEGRYFDSILEMIRWLGFEPWKVTYSSDYFGELYDLAVELIKRDRAYICHCTDQEVKANRGEKKSAPKACVHRDRPLSESLAEFEAMKVGKYRPGEAVLRMKQDLTSGNPYMWDVVAYRALDSPHHRTGSTWKIYPTYDFTHCLVDSMENISHSLCTVEFIAARQCYDWLCDSLEVYKPRQSEYGRLGLTGIMTSKRKILALVKEGYVRDWDDPRLYTLIALRRRGVPPGAILSFVSTLGVSTSPATIQVSRFEQTVRQYLESTVPRLLMVLHPLKVTIENLEPDYVLMIEKPLHPKVPELGTSKIPFTRTIYIDRDDFRLQDSKDYFRLAPGKTVGLFQAPHPLTCTSYKTDDKGEVTELICTLEKESKKKPKAFIQWVAEHAPSGSPVMVDETRIFYQLFTTENPGGAPNFRDDINPHSEDVVKGAMLEVGFWSMAKHAYAAAVKESLERTEKAKTEHPDAANPHPPPGAVHDETPVASADQLVGKECVRFQGLRVAYFALDKESKLAYLEESGGTEGKKAGDLIVLNRIVSLKEDVGKTA